MTEEPDSPEIDEVRRLLAEARHTDPMPDDVATRMDAVLADLARTSGDRSQTAPPSAGAQVVSLAAHRRRRAAGLLVAAAAIVVGGVAVAQQLPHQGSSSSATAGGAAADNNALGNTGSRHTKPLTGPTVRPENTHKTARGLVVVRPQHFSADALAGRRFLAGTAYDANTVPSSLCVTAPPHSALVRAVFRHAPAVLVYHQPAGSTQIVDLFVCGTARPLKSVTLPTN